MSNSVLPDFNTINFHIIHFNQEFPKVHLLEIPSWYIVKFHHDHILFKQ